MSQVSMTTRAVAFRTILRTLAAEGRFGTKVRFDTVAVAIADKISLAEGLGLAEDTGMVQGYKYPGDFDYSHLSLTSDGMEYYRELVNAGVTA